MIVNTADLKGSALDWAVAKCEGIDLPHGLTDAVRYSTNWCLGGPIRHIWDWRPERTELFGSAS